MPAPKLPHGYPFLFVDRVLPGPGGESPDSEGPNGARAILGVTAGATAGATGGVGETWPATLLLEAMAQATLALMTAQAPGSGSAEAEKGLLVGIDEAVFDESLIRNPLRPGDLLVSGCEVRGRFGPMVKVGAWMERDGVRVASAEMLLAGG